MCALKSCLDGVKSFFNFKDISPKVKFKITICSDSVIKPTKFRYIFIINIF